MKDIAKAIQNIVRVDSESIDVFSKESAEEISQIFIDSECGSGEITGPFLDDEGEKYYSVSKY